MRNVLDFFYSFRVIKRYILVLNFINVLSAEGFLNMLMEKSVLFMISYFNIKVVLIKMNKFIMGIGFFSVFNVKR